MMFFFVTLTGLLHVTFAMNEIGVNDNAGTITLSGIPESVMQGESFDITVHYNVPALTGQHVWFRVYLEMRNASDHAVIERVSDDNGRKGHRGPSGDVIFNVTAPSLDSFIYFTAYLADAGMNRWIVSEVETYPRDGTYPYKWEGTGVTHDINYRGSRILTNDSGNYCYCSGITYEAFMDAWETYNSEAGNATGDIWGLSVSDMKTFRQRWYGIFDRDCSTDALTRYNCGIRLDDLDHARPGDVVQIWRDTGSGHSVIFDTWYWNEENEKVRLRYWSTQSSTSGIGYNEESASRFTSETSICRVIKPADNLDWNYRLTDVDSADQPTTIGNPTPTPTPIPEIGAMILY
mgnify:CR=1 FL=1